MGLMKDMLKPTFGGKWGAANGELVSTIQQHGDGDVTVATYQNPDRIFKQNEIMRNEEGFDGYNKDRDFQRVAQVPNITVLHWLFNLGVNIYNPEHHDRVLELLDDPEFSKCKLVKGKVARKQTKRRIYAISNTEKPKIEVVGD